MQNSRLVGAGRSTGIAVDPQGNTYVTGYTWSQDFPNTPPFLPSHVPDGIDTDIFAFKLNPAGTALVFSRTFGGDGPDLGNSIALAPDGRIVVAGLTRSNGIPVTGTAFQRASAADVNAFVIRLAADGSLDYSTYLGGSGGAQATDVAVDRAGDIYVTGFAGDSFPTTADSFAPREAAGGFVSKITSANGQLVVSTYLPGVSNESTGSLGTVRVRVDNDSNIYLAGAARAGFPTTAGAFQRKPAGDPRTNPANGFVMELDRTGRNLVFATLIGGSFSDKISALVLTGDSITVAGSAWSVDFPARDHGLDRCNLASLPWALSTTFVASFDHFGKLLTSFEYGTCSNEVVTSLAAAPTGLLLAASYLNELRTFLALIDMSATAPIQVAAVVNAASLEIGAYAPLEIITVFGSGLGPKLGVSAPSGSSLPLSLAGTQVLFDGKPAPLLFVQESQINAIVPASAAPGNHDISTQVWISVIRTLTGAVPSSSGLRTVITRAAPGLFTQDGSGLGPGAILNEDGTLNSVSNPAARGSVVALFATGGGLTSPLLGDGQIATIAAPLSTVGAGVAIGDRFANVLYAGTAPGLVNGALQINARIPEDAPTGAAVPIVVFAQLGAEIFFFGQAGVTVAVR